MFYFLTAWWSQLSFLCSSSSKWLLDNFCEETDKLEVAHVLVREPLIRQGAPGDPTGKGRGIPLYWGASHVDGWLNLNKEGTLLKTIESVTELKLNRKFYFDYLVYNKLKFYFYQKICFWILFSSKMIISSAHTA